MEKLFAKIGYIPKDLKIFELALTHSSMQADIGSNQRLEFLGDSVLSLFISKQLFKLTDKHDEGDLSHMRSNLVCQSTLAKLAQHFSLGEYLQLSAAARKSGIKNQDSILADAFESLVAAIYLDGGWENCQKFLLCCYVDLLKNIVSKGAIKDPKSSLQEYMQDNNMGLPSYVLIGSRGKSHAPTFDSECICGPKKLKFKGAGPSIKIAQQEAARAAMEFFTNRDRERE